MCKKMGASSRLFADRVRFTLLGSVAIMAISSNAMAIDIKEAMTTAVETSPEIREAAATKEGIEFELQQGRGLYFPRVDLEARVGPQLFDTPGTRLRDDDDEWRTGSEVSATLEQLLFDGFGTDAEVERQAWRVDASAYRVLERGEVVGLDAAQAYLDVLRQDELHAIAQANVDYHAVKVNEINSGVRSGVLGVGDQQQARERLAAARATLAEFDEAREAARIRYRRVVGLNPTDLSAPTPATALLPKTLEEAMTMGRQNSPRIKFSRADIGTAYAEWKAARAEYFPEVVAELRGRAANDQDGVDGREDELSAQIVARYRLFGGGIDSANVQEQIRHIDERRAVLNREARDVDELVANSWNSMTIVRSRRVLLEEQRDEAAQVLNSYEREFNVGVRSLLDVLDTQNSLVQARVSATTARYAELFSEYRVLASMGTLLSSVGIAAPDESATWAVENASAPAVPDSEDMTRSSDPWPLTGAFFKERD